MQLMLRPNVPENFEQLANYGSGSRFRIRNSGRKRREREIEALDVINAELIHKQALNFESPFFPREFIKP